MELAPRRGNSRLKLGQGFSQMDWMKLHQQSKPIVAAPKELTMAEVREHNKLKMDAWMVIHNKVYNVTKYAPYHPGGLAELERGVGDDATALFEEIHPWVSVNMLDKFQVGWIRDGSKKTPVAPISRVSTMLSMVGGGSSSMKLGSSASKSADGDDKNNSKKASSTRTLSFRRASTGKANVAESEDVSQWMKCKVVNRTTTNDTRFCFVLRLKVDKGNRSLQLLQRVGTIVKLRTTLQKHVIERPFTPFLEFSNIAADSIPSKVGLSPTENCIDLFVKAYQDGIMTKHLASCKIGSTLEVIVQPSPFGMSLNSDGKLVLDMKGTASFRKAINSPFQHICMIGAGTGIMPMIQTRDLIASSLNSGTLTSKPVVSLLVANRTEADIPFKSIIQSDSTFQKVSMILSKPINAADWKGMVGRVSAQVVADHLDGVFDQGPGDVSSKSPSILFLICGTYTFNDAIESDLSKAGWPTSCIVRID